MRDIEAIALIVIVGLVLNCLWMMNIHDDVREIKQLLLQRSQDGEAQPTREAKP